MATHKRDWKRDPGCICKYPPAEFPNIHHADACPAGQDVLPTKPVPDCKVCHGEGTYWEDVAGDGGSRMQMQCECYYDPDELDADGADFDDTLIDWSTD